MDNVICQNPHWILSWSTWRFEEFHWNSQYQGGQDEGGFYYKLWIYSWILFGANDSGENTEMRKKQPENHFCWSKLSNFHFRGFGISEHRTESLNLESKGFCEFLSNFNEISMHNSESFQIPAQKESKQSLTPRNSGASFGTHLFDSKIVNFQWILKIPELK